MDLIDHARHQLELCKKLSERENPRLNNPFIPMRDTLQVLVTIHDDNTVIAQALARTALQPLVTLITPLTALAVEHTDQSPTQDPND